MRDSWDYEPVVYALDELIRSKTDIDAMDYLIGFVEVALEHAMIADGMIADTGVRLTRVPIPVCGTGTGEPTS